MKKLFTILLALTLVVSMAACGNFIPAKSASRGVIAGNTYASEYTGLSLTIPSGWSFSSDEEIANVAGIGMEALGTDKFTETLANSATVYDMMAKNDTTQESIIILFENTLKTAGKQVDEDAYLDIVFNQLSAAMGYKLISKESTTLCNNEYLKAVFSVESSGVTINQVYFVRTIDNYVASVILTSTGSTDLATMESFFN